MWLLSLSAVSLFSLVGVVVTAVLAKASNMALVKAPFCHCVSSHDDCWGLHDAKVMKPLASVS